MSFDRFWLRQLFSSADRISWKETKIASHDEMQLLEKLKKKKKNGGRGDETRLHSEQVNTSNLKKIFRRSP